MAAGAAHNPSGKVSAVFDKAKEREGAYDFLESRQVSAKALAEGVFATTAERAKKWPYVYVVIDGSSLSLPDETGRKGFGPVGSRSIPVSGVMVTSALAVAGNGTPLGLIDQIYWSREKTLNLSKSEVWKRNQERPFEDKEQVHFVHAAQHAIERLRGVGVHPWILIDREADNRDILFALSSADCVFTVRAHYDRRLATPGAGSLREELQRQPLLGSYEVAIGRTGNRPARRAVVEVRAQRMELLFRARLNKPAETLGVTAVWVHEKDDPKGGLDWILYTNAPVTHEEQARCIVEAYRARWRIEEFHRTWKQGECNVEDAQLRSLDAVIKWATILAAVATRIERLKYSSRTNPDEAALTVLTSLEIEVLQADQRDRLPKGTRRKKPPPVDTVSIADATTWIAQLGGWIGKQNGPPGSMTLARGLERLAFLVQGVTFARAMKLPR
jgi:DDE family transposase